VGVEAWDCEAEDERRRDVGVVDELIGRGEGCLEAGCTASGESRGGVALCGVMDGDGTGGVAVRELLAEGTLLFDEQHEPCAGATD